MRTPAAASGQHCNRGGCTKSLIPLRRTSGTLPAYNTARHRRSHPPQYETPAMSELVSSLLTHLVLTFVGALSALGGAGAPLPTVERTPAAVVSQVRPVIVEATASTTCPVETAAASIEDEACAAARMRWQITMHGPAPKRCAQACVAG
jgi:hypothetical protein